MAPTSASARLHNCHLYLCTGDRPDLEDFVGNCINGGVDIAQLREKHLEARDLIDRAIVMRNVCASADVPFIMNDRPDLALYVEADGVHVGQDDAPPALARQLLGPDRILGFSTHRSSEIAGALSEPCDYVSAGPVVATPTKPGRPGTGMDYIEEAVRVTATARGTQGLPVYVTGGVTPETVQPLIDVGVTRFVVVRYLTEAKDPERSARRLRDAIDEALDRRASAALS